MPDLPDGAVVLSSMDGNPETDTICFSKSRRLPVCRADYEIETEVFSQLGDIMRVSKRTNEEIPEYLSKAFYNPTGGFSGPLSSVAMRRAEQLCEHQYPHAHRDLIKVFREAEWAFKLWWDHLEDDTFVEVDDNAAKEIYTKEFAANCTDLTMLIQKIKSATATIKTGMPKTKEPMGIPQQVAFITRISSTTWLAQSGSS
jgi:hypothetical protein